MRTAFLIAIAVVAILAIQGWRVAVETQSGEAVLTIIGLLALLGAALAVYVLYETAVRLSRTLPIRAAHFWLSDLRAWVAGRERADR